MEYIAVVKPNTSDPRVAIQQKQIDRMSEGDLVMLLSKHDREILRYILTLLPHRGDAEEVLQRTAVKLWEKSAEYDTSREFLPWALRRAYYEVLNFRKEMARSKLVFSAEVVAQLADDREAQAGYLAEMQDALRKCLGKIQKSDLQLLQCRYGRSQSIQELACEVGRTAKSLYRRLDRVRALVQKCVYQRLASEKMNELEAGNEY